ncbi:unnamed protein product [Zymoseptoria tritici ST99CH_1A5]|uniref:Uncharacterized protein n=1 Tax=Zymoseptoria tritici ST99CH_1A5 TaxID=1276529 RepID=A0A1Y6LKR8_ZYMTR|nr:unnamed protein product [Zymoseptoria tritici ST99CH_1A5]
MCQPDVYWLEPHFVCEQNVRMQAMWQNNERTCSPPERAGDGTDNITKSQRTRESLIMDLTLILSDTVVHLHTLPHQYTNSAAVTPPSIHPPCSSRPTFSSPPQRFLEQLRAVPTFGATATCPHRRNPNGVKILSRARAAARMAENAAFLLDKSNALRTNAGSFRMGDGGGSITTGGTVAFGLGLVNRHELGAADKG